MVMAMVITIERCARMSERCVREIEHMSERVHAGKRMP